VSRVNFLAIISIEVRLNDASLMVLDRIAREFAALKIAGRTSQDKSLTFRSFNTPTIAIIEAINTDI